MIAGYHAKAIAEVKGAKLIGIAGRDPERTQAFASVVNAEFWTTQVEGTRKAPRYRRHLCDDVRRVAAASPRSSAGGH